LFYHIITTNNCNLNCYYCSEKAFHEPDEFPEPLAPIFNKIEYSMDELKKFIKDEDTLTFYGGEPLLNIDLVKKIMDSLPNNRFMMQTNGTLLSFLPKEYVNKFHTILVSIDGDKNDTNKYRGDGVYEKIIKNVEWIKKNGFTEELVARMTIEDQNIYDSVSHLISLGLFDSIHWQLDANFWHNDWKTRNFKDFIEQNYIPNLKKLIDFWVKTMENGSVIKLYPLLGILNTLMYSKKIDLMCGSGHSNYTIQTDGNIIPCPIMVGMKNYYLGNIKNVPKLKKVKVLSNKCKSCSYLNLCGSRCLYANIVQPWPENEQENLCKSIKFTIDYINGKTPLIKNLIKQKIIYKENLFYMKYNGVEIIP